MCFEDIDLCFKCIAYRDCFHDASHQFRKVEPEFRGHEQHDESEANAPAVVEGQMSPEPIAVEEDYSWESDVNMDDL